MIFFDLILLFLVAGIMATKNLYLGSVTLVVGLLIGLQNQRTLKLEGARSIAISTARKAKAAVLALLISLCGLPFLLEKSLSERVIERAWSEDAVLPLMAIIGLFAAAMLAALTVEKRKR